ncbi:hypothetical protein [Seleniivibrio woodruffii]|uniref:Uncharacterized protein n=1 Tax=Seleniivibrio woodruffii TaxID=1078050 RepID=A0A4R1KE55_9BACT|nr:hypothetical protein [Seleniivibrio woodruffii]TCK61539.1 hypothetical protein C8D98_0040 [Seleniivibrio woodruffii]TVZ35346.1 hypothetical protein OF66_0953 [Seleniivibrio woodruffii]
MSNDINHDKYYARVSYERLILQAPHVPFNGLWVKDNQYFAVCPYLNEKEYNVNDKKLTEWFDNECRMASSPISIVQKAPDDSLRVEERSVTDLACLRGDPLTLDEFMRELIVNLPKKFPEFKFEVNGHKLSVIFKESLTLEETCVLEETCKMINESLDVIIKTDNFTSSLNDTNTKTYKIDNPMILKTSRELGCQCNSLIKEYYEQDEDFWAENRNSVFTKNDPQSFIDKSYAMDGSACLIDATFLPPDNMRTYLTLYRRLIIVMPLAENLSGFVKALNINEKELIELTIRGRVQFILPQSIERYNQGFILQLMEASPRSLIFTRRLAAITINEMKKKMPFMFPTMGIIERRKLLEVLVSIYDVSPNLLLQSMIKVMGLQLSFYEYVINTRGSMGLLLNNFGSILAYYYNMAYGIDRNDEFALACASLDIAIGLKATIIPACDEGYSSFDATQLCASCYTGIEVLPNNVNIKNLQLLTNGLFCIDNDAPVLEVDSCFSHRDIDRVSKIIKAVNYNEVQFHIDEINKEVTKFEKDKKRLKQWDILGLLTIAGGLVNLNNPESTIIPIFAWFSNRLLENDNIDNGILDWAKATNSFVSKEAILVSRIRKNIKNI